MRRSARLHDKRKAAEEIEAAPISTAAAPETPDSQNVSTNAENVEFPTPNVPTAISDEQGTPSTGAGTTNKRSTKRSRDASEADTPGTSKQATKRRKTGKNGESSHAQALTAPTPRPSIELPREMWLRIASFLKIFPYLRLSHANKNFRQLLTQGRQAETVLTGCRRRDRPELPDPDDDTLCEWAYLELLYGIGCQSCGKPRIRKVTWQWHVRWCEDCHLVNTISSYRVSDYGSEAHVYTSLCTFTEAQMWTRWRGSYELQFYRLTDVEKARDEYTQAVADGQVEQWKARMKAKNSARMAFADLLDDELEHRKLMKTMLRSEAVRARATRLTELVDLSGMNKVHVRRCPAYQNALKSSRELTDRSWNILRRKLEEFCRQEEENDRIQRELAEQERQAKLRTAQNLRERIEALHPDRADLLDSCTTYKVCVMLATDVTDTVWEDEVRETLLPELETAARKRTSTALRVRIACPRLAALLPHCEKYKSLVASCTIITDTLWESIHPTLLKQADEQQQLKDCEMIQIQELESIRHLISQDLQSRLMKADPAIQQPVIIDGCPTLQAMIDAAVPVADDTWAAELDTVLQEYRTATLARGGIDVCALTAVERQRMTIGFYRIYTCAFCPEKEKKRKFHLPGLRDHTHAKHRRGAHQCGW